MEKLNEYEYHLVTKCNMNEETIIHQLHTDFVTDELQAREIIYSNYDIHNGALKNLRTLAKNLIAKYYFYHNNKK